MFCYTVRFDDDFYLIACFVRVVWIEGLLLLLLLILLTMHIGRGKSQIILVHLVGYHWRLRSWIVSTTSPKTTSQPVLPGAHFFNFFYKLFSFRGAPMDSNSMYFSLIYIFIRIRKERRIFIPATQNDFC